MAEIPLQLAPVRAQRLSARDLQPAEEWSEVGARGAVVLGMHRSGTSAVTGLLASAGFQVGPAEDVLPPGPDNPTGYFERGSIVRINDELLARAGGSWDSPPPREALHALSEEFFPVAARALGEAFPDASRGPVAFKDPRIGVLLPVWLPVVERDFELVLVIRNPLETARSLRQRDGMPLPVGLALWECYLTSILQDLQGRAVHIVSYRSLVEEPGTARAFFDGLAGCLRTEVRTDLSAPAPSFLDERLHRHRAALADLRQTATGKQEELFQFLNMLPAGRQVLNVPEEFRRVSAAALVLLRDYAQLSRVEEDRASEARNAELAQQKEELQARLEAMALERDQRGQRVTELEAELAALLPVPERLMTAERENESLRVSLEAAVAHLRSQVQDLHRARSREEAALREASRLQMELNMLACHVLDMRASETWRIGQLFVRPATWLRSLFKAGH